MIMEKVQVANPYAVEILGVNGASNAGDDFIVVETERKPKILQRLDLTKLKKM